MRILGLCVECLDKLSKESLEETFIPGDIVELNDSGVGIFDCPYGHKSAVAPHLEKYEILFESACLAFIDGHTRESVSSFIVSLERFIEYYIRVILLGFNIEWEEIDLVWKNMSNSSQRQLGAFHVLNLIDSKRTFSIDNWIEEFRNKIIHKGYIPKKEEVFMFASIIRDMILSVKENLINMHKEYVEKHYDRTLEERSPYTKGKKHIELANFYSMLLVKNKDDDFEKLLDQLEERKKALLEFSEAKGLKIKIGYGKQPEIEL